MVAVRFAKSFQRHVDCPPADVAGRTVLEVLDAYFATHPGVAGYVLDDRGAVRKHVAVFVGSGQLGDREHLADEVEPNEQIYVFQALSGG
jgi:hypothetical protein